MSSIVGALLATILSLYVLVRGPAVVARTGLSVVGAIAGYYAVLSSVGAITGALLPLARRLSGAVLLGGIAASLFYSGLARFMESAEEWRNGLPFYAVFGFALGMVGTYVARREFGFSTPKDGSRN